MPRPINEVVREALRKPWLLDRLSLPELLKVKDALAKIEEGRGIDGITDSPVEFAAKYSTEPWLQAPHLDLISEKLTSRIGGGLRLMVSMPPRMGKSRLISVWYALWRLARNPSMRISIVGYGADFASGWGKMTRNIMLELQEELNVKLSKDKLAQADWALTTGGGIRTTGVDGSLTGKDVDLLIIDDPIKDEKEASSEVVREGVWDWWQTAAFSRIMPHTDCVIVATRWHQDDLMGRLEKLSDNGEGIIWDILKIPAEAGEDDLLGRKKGQFLWTERFPESYWTEKKKGTTSYFWSALYQQTPVPEGGGIIKQDWWRFYLPSEQPAQFDQMLQSWDLAMKTGKENDWTVGQVWGRQGATFYLLAQARGRYTMPEMISLIREYQARFPQAVMKLIEDKASGPALIQMLRKEVPGLLPVPAIESKKRRLEAVQPLIEAGNVLLPRTADGAIPRWVDDFITEVCNFTGMGTTHDDQMDAMTQALIKLQPSGWLALSRAHREGLEGNISAPNPEEQQVARYAKWRQQRVKAYEERINTQAEQNALGMSAWDPLDGMW